MRAIKFRCWDKVDKYMYDVMTLDRYYKDENMHIRWIGRLHKYPASATIQASVSDDENKNFVLMQYTGLTDMEGQEIYEGDILEFEGVLYVCYWNNEECRFELVNNKVGDVEIFLNKELSQNVKVVGNVFENLDLLKFSADIK